MQVTFSSYGREEQHQSGQGEENREEPVIVSDAKDFSFVHPPVDNICVGIDDDDKRGKLPQHRHKEPEQRAEEHDATFDVGGGVVQIVVDKPGKERIHGEGASHDGYKASNWHAPPSFSSGVHKEKDSHHERHNEEEHPSESQGVGWEITLTDFKDF